MRGSHFCFTLVLAVLSVACTFQFQAHAAPPAPLIKHLSSLLKWTTTVASLKTPQSDENVLQFEDGYIVETVVEGNAMGVVPYKIRVSEDGELYAVDEVNSNVVKITPPLSQYSRSKLVAGSFQGYTGHIDGKPNEARFNHPKSLTMDDKGNVYIADTLNHAIRKIGDAGVTTIAGGKSNVAGFRDGPSEDAKFSNDFDVVYVHSTCSLLVVDRGNAALRQISLNQEDCDYQSNSFTMTDVLMVVGAVLIGYATCILQLGFGSSFFSRMQPPSESEYKEKSSKEKPVPIVDNMKEEPKWPSFGQLFIDLSKLALEALLGLLLCFVPSWYRSGGARKGLTPLKDSLMMPDDEVEPPSVQRQSTPAPVSENRQVHTPTTSDKYSEMKPLKIKSASFKDPSLLSKHRSSKQQEYAEFYGSGEFEPPSVQKQSTPAPVSENHQVHTPTTSDKYLEMKPPKIKSASFKDPSLLSKHRSSKQQEYAEFYGSGEVEPPSVQRQRTPAPVSENHQVHTPTTSDKYSEMKPPKIKSASFKDPSLLSKHRSSKQQEYAEFYGSGEVPSHGRSKSHREKSRHRQRDKSGEIVFGAVGVEPKPAEMKPVDYNGPKFDHYNIRSKYGSDSSYRF